MRTIFIISLVLMSLVSFTSWADHINPIIDLDQKPYNERCVVDGRFGIPPDCLCMRSANGVCTKYASEAEYKMKVLKDLHDADVARQAREKAFNKCMFKNIKPSSNAAHYSTVRKYCKDQASE